jgi:hypothetical protein
MIRMVVMSVDGGAERRPPSGVGDVLAALASVFEPVAGVAEHAATPSR